jgi:hypothetical protein
VPECLAVAARRQCVRRAGDARELFVAGRQLSIERHAISDAAAIRAAFDRGGELLATVELRRLFPGVTDNAQARECARAIAAWKPLPVKPRLVRLLGTRR